MIERIEIPGASYSAAVATGGPGRTVYVSGKISDGPDLRSQAEAVFDQIAADLDELGGSLANVVRITAYLTDLAEYSEYSRVRDERFGGVPPASVAVRVAGLLQGALIEVDAVAFLPDQPSS